jgi:hypothetical protein
VIGREPAAIQLRYLQTVNEIASENNSTTIFPIPIDMFRAFAQTVGGAVQAAAGPPALPAQASGERVPPAADRSAQKA